MKLICEHCGNADEFIIDRAVTYVCVYGSDGKVLRVNNGPMEVGDIQCAKCFNTTVADTNRDVDGDLINVNMNSGADMYAHTLFVEQIPVPGVPND